MGQQETITQKICKNCMFWQMTKLEGGYGRIPEVWPGKCMVKPAPIHRNENDIACKEFDNKYNQ